MTRGVNRRWAELGVELAPAALLNFAVAFAVATLFRQAGLDELAAPASVASGIAAFLIAWHLVRRTGSSTICFALPQFEDAPLEAAQIEPAAELPELLLTEQHSKLVEQQDASELLLDDILESLGPDSRVVRLFDPARNPTAGELQERIERHLQCGGPVTAPPDASKALHEAILALRQSLRC